MALGTDIAGMVILSIIPLLFLVARFLAKRSKLLPWSFDDALLVLALLLLYSVVAMFIVCEYFASCDSSFN
jgi:uncharacterized membrane protein YbhN (UPF0104 family)